MRVNADVTVLPPRPVLTAGRVAKKTVGRKMTDRILVVGAGAIGGVTAAHLARAGHDVTTLDANVEHSALLVSPGLILEEPSGNTSTTPIRAVTDVSQLDGPFDFALITVKSLAIRAAITPLVDKDLVDTYVSLGNGLVQDVVESVVGRDRLIVGLVEWGATNLGPGHLRRTTEAPMVVGELSGELTERLQRLQRRPVECHRAEQSLIGDWWSCVVEIAVQQHVLRARRRGWMPVQGGRRRPDGT